MQGDLQAMLRQLPTSTEMPNLLDDVSNTGKSNGLEFELFKPEADKPLKDFTAKPITIKARGTYHQFGVFVSGVAALPRIVTLENATLEFVNDKDIRLGGDAKGAKASKAKNEPLKIQATLQTYRYGAENNASPTPGATPAKAEKK